MHAWLARAPCQSGSATPTHPPTHRTASDEGHSALVCLLTSAPARCLLPQAGLLPLPEVAHQLQMRSTEPFALTSFALSLLLVFRCGGCDDATRCSLLCAQRGWAACRAQTRWPGVLGGPRQRCR